VSVVRFTVPIAAVTAFISNTKNENSYLDNVTLNEWSAGPSETVLLYVPGGGSLILNDGGEELYRAIL
jgi:hypothetical protein